ncbi:hypothetical protein JA1_004745 [Spathaspora sp. JA1]|nr:hypothetical protein JA1_004745 [Spathaspora sp. JA1]
MSNPPESYSDIEEYLTNKGLTLPQGDPQFTQLIQDLITSSSTSFNWDKLEECFVFAITEYAQSIEQLELTHGELIQKHRAWTEVYCTVDRDRSVARIRASEEYIRDKQGKLDAVKDQLKNAICLIKNQSNF